MVGVGAPGGGDRFGRERRGVGGGRGRSRWGVRGARGGGGGPSGYWGGGGGGVGCASALGICQGRRETRLLFLIKEPAFIEG